MGSPVLATETVSGVTGNVSGPPEGSGGPPGGSTCPGGPYGLYVERDQPLSGLGASPPRAHAPRVWGNPKGGAPPLPWGARQPPWPPPPPHIGSEGAGPPLPCPYIYVGVGGQPHHMFWRSPPPLPSTPPLSRCLAKPCRIATLLRHHHAVVLLLDGVFLNLSISPCWIKSWETSPGCTCVERGGAVRSALGSSVIWITTSTTPSTPSS